MSDVTARMAVAALYSAADDLGKTHKPLYVSFEGFGMQVETMRMIARRIASGEPVPVDLLGHFMLYVAQQLDRACKAE